MNQTATLDHRRKFLWRVFKRASLFVLALCVLVNVVFSLTQESFILEPNVDPPAFDKREAFEKAKVDEHLAADGSVLPKGANDRQAVDVQINFQKFISPMKPTRGVLFYLHGNKGSLDQCRSNIEPFLIAGYDVWTTDYRGFGSSRGSVSEAALLADALMVYNHILETEQIDIVWGRSFGSGIATYIAANGTADKAPKRLVLETPYRSIPDAARHKYPFLIPWLFRYEFPTHEFLEGVKCPVHIIHGTADEKIYFGSSTKLETRCRELGLDCTLHRIDGGEHDMRPSRSKGPRSTDAPFNEALRKSLELQGE